MKNKFTKIIEWYKGLPTKKSHVEFITAVLSVPVMLTVIILNLNNLAQQKNTTQKQSTSDKTTPIQVIITGEKNNTPTQYSTPQPSAPTGYISPTMTSCIKEVGPVSILSPRENEVVSKNPLCITIATQSNYCGVTWSYRFDNGDWSDYSDNSICLHSLANGNQTIQLRIRSQVSDDAVTLQRSFIYQGSSEPTVLPTVATSSAGL